MRPAIAAAVTAVAIVIGGAALAGVRTYGTPGETLNGGITYGACGIEVWGTPGHFCGND